MEAVELVHWFRPQSKLWTLTIAYQTQSVAKAIEAKDFNKAMSLRDPEFEEGLITFHAITRLDERLLLPQEKRMRVAIMQCVLAYIPCRKKCLV